MLKEARESWHLTEFEKPLVTASYFGFMPIAAPKVLPEDLEAVSHCTDMAHFDAVEKVALIRTYLKENMASLPHPLALIYKIPAKRRRGSYALHYIGTTTGLAEAALIRAALSILSEEGHKSLRVELNSVGDKDSFASYERELINFIRKFGGELSEELKAELKSDAFNLFRNHHESMVELRQNAPTSLSFLSTPSRNLFKEVLEYIEALSIEFGLAPELIGEKNHSSHVIYGIRASGIEAENHGSEYLAMGYRYSRLCRRMGLRKEIPMASVTLFMNPETEWKIYKELPRPKFYLVQLGREAKVKTLNLLEMLRSYRIPVHHFLGKDKLSFQLASAEELRVSYLIIIGHKEALDGTATIRNVETRAQDTIPLGNLPAYLKHIRL